MPRRRGGSASVPSAGRAQRVMGTMPALMGSAASPRPRASEIKRKRRKRRFDSNTKQIIPPGTEQNKSEWSLTAVIPTRKASAGGRGAGRPRKASQGRCPAARGEVLAPSTAAGRWVGKSWPAGLRILPVI